jgi:16S rRNA processing protein RimM
MDSDEFLLVGYITAPFGLQGQVKLKAITDQPDHLQRRVRTLYLRPGSHRHRPSQQRFPPRPYHLLNVFEQKPGLLILTLKDVTTRDAAEDICKTEVFIHEQDALPLDEDEYYLHQLYAMRVETTEGVEIGEVREVIETGGNEVLIVTRPGQPDALIPLIHDVVEEIDMEAGRIVIQVIEGLL